MMNSTTETAKPTREELKQRLQMAKMRSNLSRMPKKQRDEKVEKLKATMEDQQKAFMEQIKTLSPEQLKALGMNLQNQPNPAAAATESPAAAPKQFENNNDILINNAVLKEPITIPKMKPVSETVNTQNRFDI
jgi:dsDNA-specific endonuclease/ATPase MutS2